MFNTSILFFFWLMSNNTSLRFGPHMKSQNENKTNLLSVKFKLNNSRPKNILLLFADNVGRGEVSFRKKMSDNVVEITRKII